MLEEALTQVPCRLPSARDTAERLSKLSPVIILNQISRPMFSELHFTHHAGNNVSNMKEQYRQMHFVDCKEEAQFKKGADTEQYWKRLLQYKAFKELATFALPFPITPVSNAAVDRIFSLVSCVKRNCKKQNAAEYSSYNFERQGRNIAFKQMLQRLYCISRNAKKTSPWTSSMPYVPYIPVGRM
jgi:hypothetical protein